MRVRDAPVTVTAPPNWLEPLARVIAPPALKTAVPVVTTAPVAVRVPLVAARLRLPVTRAASRLRDWELSRLLEPPAWRVT